METSQFQAARYCGNVASCARQHLAGGRGIYGHQSRCEGSDGVYDSGTLSACGTSAITAGGSSSDVSESSSSGGTTIESCLSGVRHDEGCVFRGIGCPSPHELMGAQIIWDCALAFDNAMWAKKIRLRWDM